MKEGQTVEFKESWRDEYLRTLCAFANTDGGVFYLGISDEGKPVGLKNIKHLLESLPNKIRNNLNIIPSVKVERIEGKEVIKIEIASSEVPISYKGRFYIRAGSTTQEVSGSELIKIIMKRQKLSWDAILSDAGIEEIDGETVLKFKDMAKERLAISESDTVEKILENLELIRDGKITNAGILLFGKNPQKYLLNSISRVGRFKAPTEILDSIEIKGNLFAQIEELVKAIKKHINVRFEIKGIERKDIWDYPIPAIREACINALIHRDYMDTAEIQIKIYDDHIWFWNPGKLPEGLTVEMLKGEHYSKPRNKLIAMVFYYAGLIEKWGTGTKRIVELCKNKGLPEPEFKEFGNGFSVTFHKDIYNEEYLRKLGLNDRQIKAVLYVKEKGKITNREYQEITGVKKRQATDDLRELEEVGIFQRIGTTGKGVYYTLKGHQRGETGIKGASKGHYIIRYFCKETKSIVIELLNKIKEKQGIDFEIVINSPWNEEKDKEIYEKYFKPRSRVLKKRVGNPITKLRSKKARHYFVSIPGTIALFKDGTLEYWEFATDEGVGLLKDIWMNGEEKIKEILGNSNER